METLLELRAAGDEAAAQAVEMFCYQGRRAVGSLTAVMGGIDLLVFTGGIGEKAVAVRTLMCDGLGHLGIVLDPAKNASGAEVISAGDAACVVRIVHTNEELMIARHTYALVFGAGAVGTGGATPSAAAPHSSTPSSATQSIEGGPS